MFGDVVLIPAFLLKYHSVIPLAVTIAVNYMAASKEVSVLSYRPFYEAFVKLVFAK